MGAELNKISYLKIVASWKMIFLKESRSKKFCFIKIYVNLIELYLLQPNVCVIRVMNFSDLPEIAFCKNDVTTRNSNLKTFAEQKVWLKWSLIDFKQFKSISNFSLALQETFATLVWLGTEIFPVTMCS